MDDGKRETLGERVAVVEQRLDGLAGEIGRLRDFKHLLEADRAAWRLLAKELEQVAHGLAELTKNIEHIAASAAEKAVTLALSNQAQSRREGMGLRMQFVSVGAAVVGVASGLYFGLR